MTTVDLDVFSSYTLSNAGDAIIAFQQDPTNPNWTTMNIAITTVLNDYTLTPPAAVGDNPQITVTMYDGTVAYWSDSSNNTWGNFTTKTISDNRNNRAVAMTALLSTAGIGYGTFVSTIRGTYFKISTKYTRTGFSSIEPLGLVGCSLNAK